MPTSVPTTSESPWQSLEPEVTTHSILLPDNCWAIGAERWSGDGRSSGDSKLWPTYTYMPSAKATWIRPQHISVPDAAAAYELAVQEWFKRKRQTDPDEAKWQEKKGIVRNFTWPN